MSEVFFYHLTRSSMPQTVFELCGKCLSRDWKVMINGPQNSVLKQLDQALWLAADDAFLGHGLLGGEHDQFQPVLLTSEAENVNQAEVLMLVGGATIDVAKVKRFSRVCLIFDGGDDSQLQQARSDWKQVSDAKIAAQYWSQESGKWSMKAESNASSNED